MTFALCNHVKCLNSTATTETLMDRSPTSALVPPRIFNKNYFEKVLPIALLESRKNGLQHANLIPSNEESNLDHSMTSMIYAQWNAITSCFVISCSSSIKEKSGMSQVSTKALVLNTAFQKKHKSFTNRIGTNTAVHYS